MRRFILHPAAHRARMAGRAARNRVGCRASIRGSGHTIVTDGAVLRNVRLDVRGQGHRIEVAPQARLSNLSITLEGVGHRLLIGSHVGVHAGEMTFYDDHGTISIGERTTIYGAAFGVTEGGRISVGRDCLLSSEVDLRNGDSHSILDVASGERLNPAADVTIGDHVWLGVRVLVLKGSRIAAHSVVGAGSIVSEEFPAGSVVAGVPARLLRGGVTWERERL
ncbi:MAG: acyltransferase [Solirubrobacterales bacterium]|nr:acyltransferase [Solirubrobacterales bacterium]